MMQGKTYRELQKNLLMFYTGTTRSANSILSEQKKNITQDDKNENLRKMCKLAEEMKESLEHNDLSNFGKILNDSWKLKRTLASGISNPDIDRAYEIALESGALGGKLLGAGGGGFLLFYCEESKQDALRKNIGLKEFDFKFDKDGTSIVYIGDKYW
jgi:D-glycero-alpha-D-manno-heptose-7-phosphate kinase